MNALPTVEVIRVPGGDGLDEGPLLVVTPVLPGVQPLDLYREAGEDSRCCPSGVACLALVAAGVFNSPDQVHVTGWEPGDCRFGLDLETRIFTGPLAANDPWLALVRAELGKLATGAYQFSIRETVLRFAELDHPEACNDRTIRERHARFQVD